jgi:AraC-like DNA-binding protein
MQVGAAATTGSLPPGRSILGRRPYNYAAHVHIGWLLDRVGDAARDCVWRDCDRSDAFPHGRFDGGVGHRVRKVRRDHTGRDFGDPQVRPRLLPQGFGDGPHGVLGRGIDSHGRQDFDPRRRHDIDDVARLLALKHRQGRSNSVQRPAQIDVDHSVPVVHAQRIETRYGPDPGIVDDDVELTTPFDGQGHEGLKVCAIADVGHSIRRLAACGDDLVHDSAQRIATASAEHDGRPAFGEQFRCRAADPAARACDGDDLSRYGHCQSPSVEILPFGARLSMSERPWICRQAADPLSDVLTVLGAKVSRLTRLEAAGTWALAFPPLERLKFVALLKGVAWLISPDREPQMMGAGDVCLIGRTTYAVASEPNLPLHDGQPLFEGRDVARLGGDETIALGGSVVFSPGNSDFLLDILPNVLLVPRASPASSVVTTVLALLAGESARSGIGGQIVSARLADVLLVEAIRAYAAGREGLRTGWLGALSDPRLGRALRVIHADIAQPWTVAKLASEAGMSRAAFSAAFTRQVGQPPLGYVRAWRLTLARAALAQGDADVAEIGRNLG